uniref:C2 domain-containing protein n=1 Tax=Gopherus evgoodei TaxID=1825980 RepID=A0A8C4YL01_9SAUR
MHCDSQPASKTEGLLDDRNTVPSRACRYNQDHHHPSQVPRGDKDLRPHTWGSLPLPSQPKTETKILSSQLSPLLLFPSPFVQSRAVPGPSTPSACLGRHAAGGALPVAGRAAGRLPLAACLREVHRSRGTGERPLRRDAMLGAAKCLEPALWGKGVTLPHPLPGSAPVKLNDIPRSRHPAPYCITPSNQMECGSPAGIAALAQAIHCSPCRAAIRGNVELIRLQRLLRERSCQLAVTRGRFTDLQENQETLRTSSEALLAQLEALTVQLKAETQKVMTLESKVERVSFLQGTLEEVGSPGDPFLPTLRPASLVRRGWGVPRERPIFLQPPCLDRLPTETEPEELFTQRNLSRKLLETEAAHADTILELEKTRDMLILQHRINRDYQAELEGVMVQAEQEKRGHEEKQQKMVQLLDLRSTRIRQLEEQLKDVAYGTRQLPLLRTEGDVDVEEGKAPVLRRGENLFELHIAGAVLSGEALQLLGEVQPVTFCTYAFYDFETHCTPVVRGARPRYSFTSQYVIQAEPFFLQYLQRAAARLDLHLATATDHRTLASCWLRFQEVLGSGERMHATAMLHGPSGENYGMLEYWMRLRLPMEQTMRLHCQRTKALGYLSACVPQARDAQQSRQQDKEGVLDAEWLWNELQVQIVGCTGLRGCWLSTQPSPYAMYRFFTFPDHDTPIIPSSNNPHFGDLRTFPMRPTAELDRYLRLESLWVYIFDDEDTEPGSYLGKAQIPLLPLAHGHSITGDFVLTNPAGHPNGSISLSLEWKHRYLPLGATLHQAAWAREHQRETPLEQTRCRRLRARPGEYKPHLFFLKSSLLGPHRNCSNWAPHFLKPALLPVTSTLSLPAPEEACEPALESNSDAQTTDSDEIVVGTSLRSPPKDMERIRIEIVSLSLHPEAEAMASEHIQQLYVAYHFPGVPLSETETPLSLRKPQGGEEIYFHFSKGELLWAESGSRPGLVQPFRLQFMVVSEPRPGTGGECEDVGFAHIDLREILLTGNDVLECDLDGE